MHMHARAHAHKHMMIHIPAHARIQTHTHLFTSAYVHKHILHIHAHTQVQTHANSRTFKIQGGVFRLFPLCLAFLVGASAKGIVAPAEHSVLEPLKIKQADKATALLDINQIVYIENSPVLGGGAGEGALNNCQAFAAAHVANPATPEVKVCGTGIKATFFLRGRCQEYSSHY